MDADKLDELRAIADGATPGPWSAEKRLYVDGTTEIGRVSVEDDDGDMSAANADFIATFNPSVVKAMLDVVEAAHRARHWTDDLDDALAALADKLK